MSSAFDVAGQEFLAEAENVVFEALGFLHFPGFDEALDVGLIDLVDRQFAEIAFGLRDH